MKLPETIHRFLRIPYILHVERRGKKGPKVVLIHGLASTGDIWDETVAELCQTYRCIQIDLLGHGASPKPTHISYDTTDHERSLAWTLFWRGIWGRKIIVCHSMGGLIALRYAARSRTTISHLILVGLPIYKGNKMAETAEQAKQLEGLIDKGLLVFYRALRALPKSTAIRSAQALTKALPRIAGATVLNEDTWYPAVSSLAHTIEAQTAIQDLSKIPADLPITLIYGRLDQLVLARNLKQVQQSHRRTTLVPVLAQHELSPKTTRSIIRALRNRR